MEKELDAKQKLFYNLLDTSLMLNDIKIQEIISRGLDSNITTSLLGKIRRENMTLKELLYLFDDSYPNRQSEIYLAIAMHRTGKDLDDTRQIILSEKETDYIDRKYEQAIARNKPALYDNLYSNSAGFTYDFAEGMIRDINCLERQ